MSASTSERGANHAARVHGVVSGVVCGVVLAGGRSRRMGRDKSFVEVDGVPLRELMRRVLAAVCDDVIVVGGVDADVPDVAVPDVPDDAADRVDDPGPLRGVLSALESGRGDIYVVVPVDMPGLVPALLARLAGHVEKTGRSVAFSGHPLPVAVPQSHAARVRAQFIAGERRMRVLADDVIDVTDVIDDVTNVTNVTNDIQVGPTDSARVFANLNTPADLHVFRQGAPMTSKEKPRWLMVCLGNICRSPTAEACVRAAAARAGVDVDVASCGTGNWHEGDGADPRTVRHAAARGLDLSRHRARALRANDFANFDRLYAMDKNNLRELQKRCPPEHQHKLALFVDDGEVPDPYHGGPADFERVLDLCTDAAARAVRSLAR